MSIHTINAQLLLIINLLLLLNYFLFDKKVYYKKVCYLYKLDIL